MLALAGVLAVAGVGVATAAGLGQEGASAAIGAPEALSGPARDLQRSIERFRRREVKRLRSSRLVLGVPRSTLEAIASCESGGSPTRVSADGTYRGKYQFSYSTWASVGGRGDPARAGELEQDLRAAMLYQRGGSSPWPACGS
jgi:hypothetical protein